MPTVGNVRLATGYKWHEDGSVTTLTSLFTVVSENGVITSLDEQDGMVTARADEIDAAGLLGIPPAREMHVHLDKGHFGGPWQAVVPVEGGVSGRIREEQQFLPEFLAYLPERADALVKHFAANGTRFIRAQTNVDPTIGLQNLEIVRDVLASHAPRIESEIVAFPQHGTLVTEAQGLLTQALEAGAPVLGGLDPASIDGDIETSLTTTFTLASSFDREIDFHLHDGGEIGIYTIQRIIDYTRDFGMTGRVAISHALALGYANDEQLAVLADGLAQQGIAIFTTQPLSYASTTAARAVPWLTLQSAGVEVAVISDTVNDHWSPFGTGDPIERASRAAEIWGQTNEIALAEAYSLVSDGVLPLSSTGEQQWPSVGDEATMLLINASCLSEVVARIPKQRTIMFQGEIDTPPPASATSSHGGGNFHTPV